MTAAKRLILSIVGFSFLITLVSTSIQLYIDYKDELETIDERFNEIKHTRLPNLTHNVWVLDDEQIRLHMISLVNSPYIEHVSISNNGETRWLQGTVKSKKTLTREYTLRLNNEGQEFNLGVFKVVAGLSPVFKDLRKRALIILASNAVLIFFIAGFFLILFQLQISRHLLALSGYARHLKLDGTHPALKLQRQNTPESPDELDDVVSALNLMKSNIETSYLALRESEQYNRMLFEQSPIGLALMKSDGSFTDINPAFLNVIKYPIEEIDDLSLWHLITAENYQLEKEVIATLSPHSATHHAEKNILNKSGFHIPVEMSFHLLDRAGERFIGVSIQDISKRKASELALARSEEQLRQSEKMRAVGELTGGVAHDFNNLLAVVLGNAELIDEKLPNGSSERRQMKTLISACMRGAELTQHLLAFSRKQTLNPTTTNLSQLMDKMVGMLVRILGEDIGIHKQFKEHLWECKIDQGLLENAVLNLAINARDAINASSNIPGQLTLMTENVVVDDDMASQHTDVEAGEYVIVSVEDNGTGIPKDIQKKIFEPFFTTKPVGQGTGLGLSMIYGFIKQSGGFVVVFSKENYGTNVKLYLPRSSGETARKAINMENPKLRTGCETILVLEDDPDVRELTVLQLKSLGYNVLQAHDGRSALEVLHEEKDIDLLLSDVVLPGGMRGPEVAVKAREDMPELKVLFMSGYTQNALESHSELGETALLLNKPFRKKDLSEKIREAIESA
jgi:PAS domain S-box-containing protein